MTKEFIPNWKLHPYCPICANKSLGGCKCILSDQSCKNNHQWFICPVHGKTVLGESSHKIASDVCQCNNTAWERTKISFADEFFNMPEKFAV